MIIPDPTPLIGPSLVFLDFAGMAVFAAPGALAGARPRPDLGTLAAPVLLEGNAPFVLACIGASQGMTRARVERELGPRLLAMAGELQSDFNAIGH